MNKETKHVRWVIDPQDSSLIRRLPEVEIPHKTAQLSPQGQKKIQAYREALSQQPTATLADKAEFEAILKEKGYLEEGVDFKLEEIWKPYLSQSAMKSGTEYLPSGEYAAHPIVKESAKEEVKTDFNFSSLQAAIKKEAKDYSAIMFPTGNDSRIQAIEMGIIHGANWMLQNLYLLRNADSKDKAAEAKAYREQGLTIREIAKIMGYKNPGSISHLLNSEKI